MQVSERASGQFNFEVETSTNDSGRLFCRRLLSTLEGRLLVLMCVSGLVGSAVLAKRFYDVAMASQQTTAAELADRLAVGLAENAYQSMSKTERQLRLFRSVRDSKSSNETLVAEAARTLFDGQSSLLSLVLIRRQTDGSWVANWIERSQSSVVENWPFKVEQSLAEPLVRDFSGDGYFVTSIEGPRKTNRVALFGFSVGSEKNLNSDEYLVGIYDMKFLTDILRPLKGAVVEYALFQKGGTTLVQGEKSKLTMASWTRVTVARSNLEAIVRHPIRVNGSGWWSALASFLGLAAGTLILTLALGRYWILRKWRYQDGVMGAIENADIASLHLKTNPLYPESEIYSRLAERVRGMKASISAQTEGLDFVLAEKAKAEKLADAQPPELPISDDAAKASVLLKMTQNLSSDLRQPLSALLGQVSLARADKTGEDLERHLDSIEADVRSAKSLVDRIYRLNHMNEIEKELVPAGRLIQSVVEALPASPEGQPPVRIRKDLFEVGSLRSEKSLLVPALVNVIEVLMSELRNRGLRDMILRLEPSKGSAGQQIATLILSEVTASLLKETQATGGAEQVLRAFPQLSFAVAVLEAHQAVVSLRLHPESPLTFWVEFPSQSVELSTAANTAVEHSAMLSSPVMEALAPTIMATSREPSVLPQNLPRLPEAPKIENELAPFEVPKITLPPMPLAETIARMQEVLMETEAVSADSVAPELARASSPVEDEFFSGFRLDSTLIPPAPQADAPTVRIRKPKMRI